MGRYTIHDDERVDAVVDAHLAEIVAEVRDALGDDLVAVLVCGGFGRGEGSVVIDAEAGPRPLNDYDLTLLVRGAGGHDARLQPVRERLEERLQVQIDLGVFGCDGLGNREPTILIYEIREGHRVLWGDPARIRFPDFPVTALPLEEGTDLLFNRGMSLLQSRLERGDGWPGRSRGQCAIHIQKAVQAWGDAALLAAGRYVLSYQQRVERVAALDPDACPPIPELQERYGRAVDRKLLPRPGDPDPEQSDGLDTAIADHEACYRWFEELRTGRTWSSWPEYAGPATRKTARPQRLRNRLLNPLRNLRQHGARALRAPWTLTRSPRERLIAAFPAVLFGSPRDGDAALRALSIAAGGDAARKEYLRRWH